MKMKLLALMIVVMLLISGCVSKKVLPSSDYEQTVGAAVVHTGGGWESSGDPGILYNGVTFIHDDRRNVSCWISSYYNAGGISCIPDWQLEAPGE